jgi:hypothetical protein
MGAGWGATMLLLESPERGLNVTCFIIGIKLYIFLKQKDQII